MKYRWKIISAFFFLIFILFLISENGHPEKAGQIFLYGEIHSAEIILNKKFQLWYQYYHDNGIRDLFVEHPYYTAEFLNLWMQSENDDILNELYADWEGTAAHSEENRMFYKRIKEECPETIFHGTDVGHQYATIGRRFAKYLQDSGQTASEQYALTLEAIRQGMYYYRHSDREYREKAMSENFMREFNRLNGSTVVGFYGAAHTGPDTLYMTNTASPMVNQLKSRYGEAVHPKTLISLISESDSVRTGKISIGGREYTALSFGRVNISSFSPEYQYREFWRLENAYEDFKNNEMTGDVLPYTNYPVTVKEGQVFVIDYTKTDGSVTRTCYRSDGTLWHGKPATCGFIVPD